MNASVAAPVTLQSELPWLAPAQQRLLAAAARERLPTGLLIHGTTGIGAVWFARWAAALVLCEQRANAPCGRCQSCLRVDLNQHPDLLWVTPQDDSREIRVDQVRGLSAELSLTSHAGGYKLAVLSPAERLNRNAANALLKTLEEPLGRCMLVLVAAQPGGLPATLRSRCQRIDLLAPTASAAENFVRAQGGGADALRLLEVLGLEPLTVLDIDAGAVLAVADDTNATLRALMSGGQDIVAIAERWAREHYEWRLSCVENWLTDCVRSASGDGRASAKLGVGAHLPAGRPALNIRSLFEQLDGIRELRRLAEAPLNKSLAIERLLWRMNSNLMQDRR